MIQGGGQSKKAVNARDETEDEENSSDVDTVPKEVDILTPTTPSALVSSVLQPHADQASLVPQACIDECRYVEDPPTHHFRPADSKDNYQDHQAEYPTHISRHSFSGHAFKEDFAESSDGNMSKICSHADNFLPDAQQVMLGNLDLYGMSYTSEHGQPPTTHPPDGNHIFGHYPYERPPKQPYRSEGYSADVYGSFPAWWNGDFFPPPSTPRFHSGT
jgi:hypothetical protein